MKQLLILLFLLIVFKTSHSQNDCEYRISVPDELNRGRYKPDGMKYGNPYTMFNKRKSNWNLESDLSTIRTFILTQVNDTGSAYGYAEFYKKYTKRQLKANQESVAGVTRTALTRYG